MKRSYSSTTIIFTILVIAIVALLIFAVTRPKPGEFVSTLGNQHIASIDTPHAPYNTIPPTSGPHIGSIAPWGVSETQIPDEMQVHNLEDGGVIVHYDPERTESTTLVSLTEIVNAYHEGVILEPYADLSHPIVLTAWSRIDRLESLDTERIQRFIQAFRGIDHHQRY